ncbi:MAG: TrkH family potassium uptake protein, partial [Gemmatimonadetes bacterium]|nr:TrkH family potassium uptake protein [Gemmatimonadota bacterium]
MSLRRVLNVVGLLQVFVGLSMLLAGGVSLFYMDGDSLGIFLAAVVTIVFGVAAFKLTKFKGEIRSREGFAMVTFAWTGAALFGALPYL